MAASSLTDAFERIETDFETENPDIDVVMVFGASSTLANQIVDGAKADIFASADIAQFDELSTSITGDEPTIFATNRLTILVKSGNPKAINSLDDLARDDVLVATAEEGVPIRTYTDRLLTAAGVTANFVTFEANVAGIVTKVSSGAADAGMVYESDVVGTESSVQAVAIPADVNITARYPIAALTNSTHLTDARRFVDYVTSTSGRATLIDFGFGEP